MPRSIEVYQTFGALEWANKYYIQAGNPDSAATIAANIYTAQKVLQINTIVYSRYRYLESDGTLISEGSVTGSGTAAGEMMPIHYALFIRLSGVTEIGRPSSKYIHGWSEGFQSGGVIVAAGTTAFNTYAAAILSYGLANSNGAILGSLQLRGFSRRKRMRRLTA